MVVVFGGVGNLWGTLIGGMSMGVVNKLLEPYAGAVLGQDLRARRADPVHPAASARAVPADRPRRGEHVMTVARPAAGGAAATTAAAPCFWRCSPWRRSSCRCSTWRVPPSSPLHLSTYVLTLHRQVPVLRDAGAGGRSDLGLLRHPQPRPRRVLLARRLRDGHVPDAPDRHARRLRRSDAARLHGVPELEGAAVVLARLQPLLVRAADGGAGARRCWRSSSAGWRSARASPASICRSSRRRSATR